MVDLPEGIVTFLFTGTELIIAAIRWYETVDASIVDFMALLPGTRIRACHANAVVASFVTIAEDSVIAIRIGQTIHADSQPLVTMLLGTGI